MAGCGNNPNAAPPKHTVIDFASLHLPIYSDAVPSQQKEVPPALREGFAEVTAGLTEREALHEARRCLSCGNCYECDNCLAACPEAAITKLGPTLGYSVDLTLCTGCAACFEQCPCHAIDMVSELPEQGYREMSTRITMDGNTAVAPCRLPRQRGLRDLPHHARPPPWRSWPTSGWPRGRRISGAISPWYRRCRAKAARPVPCMARCNPAR